MLNAFVGSIYDALAGNTALQTKISGGASDKKIYNVIARQDASLPYITIGFLTGVPMGVFRDLTDMEDCTVYVNIFSNSGSAKEAGEILDLVKAVLDDANLTITGYANDLWCKREFVGATLYDMSTKVWMIPMRYRVLAEKD